MTILMIILVAAIGLAAIAVTVWKPHVGLFVLIVPDVANLNVVVEQQTGIAPYRAELALALLAVVVLIRRGQFRFAWSPVHLGVAVLTAAFAATLFVSADPSTSFDLQLDRLQGAFSYLLVIIIVLSTRSLVGLVKAVTATLALLALVTIFHEYVLHNAGDVFGLSQVPIVQEGGASTPRHSGTSADVNFWARLLLLFTPLAMALAASSRGLARIALWIGASGALLVGIYLTQSRGGFLALFLAVVIWFLLAGRRFRLSLLALPVLLIIVVPAAGIGSRLLTLFSGTPDLSLITRQRFQADALKMFIDSPVFGHGIGSYPALFPIYDRDSNFYYPVNIAPAAHNFFLEQLADGGVILMAAWIFFYGTIFFAAGRAYLLAQSRLPKLLAAGLMAGLTGWLIASAFLHLSDYRSLLFFAGVAAILDIRMRAVPPPVLEVREIRPVPRWRPVVVGVVAVLSLGAATLSIAGSSTQFTATAVLAITPESTAADGTSAYSIDLVSRGQLSSTFADVIRIRDTSAEIAEDAGVADPTAYIDVGPSRLGGAVQLIAHAASAEDASRLLEAARERAIASVDSLDADYVLAGDATLDAPVASIPWETAGALGALGVALALIALVDELRILRQRSRRVPANRTLVTS